MRRSPINSLSSARSIAELLLATFESCNGAGTDDYSNDVRVHPMAEGKYLSAMTVMRRIKLLSASAFTRRLDASLDRLERCDLLKARDECGAAWGLGFAYRDAPADEPYVVTTAIVAAGLFAAGSERSLESAGRALQWLDESAPRSEVAGPSGTLRVHQYQFSPVIRETVVNAAALAAGVLHIGARSIDHRSVADWIVQLHDGHAGWWYTASVPKVDLLHQCYIIAALLDLDRLDDADELAQRTLPGFFAGHELLDKISVISAEKAATAIVKSSHEGCFFPTSDVAVYRHGARARIWSIGELLHVVSRLLVARTNRAPLWNAMLRRLLADLPGMLARHAQSIPDWAIRVRHSMHLAHGLACAIEALRLQASDTGSDE
jgi:hypothetical protein